MNYNRIFTRIFLISSLLLLANPAHGDDLLSRLEQASETMSENQSNFYASKVPSLKDKLPNWEWDEELRNASNCVLEGIKEAKGLPIAEAYVKGIESEAQQQITSISQINQDRFIPDELKGEDSILLSLMQSCKALELSIECMQESGLWQALSDPKVMQQLISEQ